MISYEHECIFVHIPRTGGTSIEDLIWPDRHNWTPRIAAKHLFHGFISPYQNTYQTGGMQHLFAKNIRLDVGSVYFDNYFKFTIVRNPWDKAISQYRYMVDRRPVLLKFCGLKKTDSFKTYLNIIRRVDHVQWEPQWRFFTDDEGKCLANAIYRFENFEKIARNILRKLGIRKNIIPHINKTKRTHYHDYYGDETKEMVAEIYAKDIEILGYQF